MQLTQFETIIDNENIDNFMNYFGFEFPETDVEIPYLNEEWYKFNLDRRIASHRTKDVKLSYEVLRTLVSQLRSCYGQWDYKYQNLYNGWVSKLDAEKRLPDAEARLTKPLYAYKQNNHGIYNVEKAALVQSLKRQLKNANDTITRNLEISDQLPLPDKNIPAYWENLQYVINSKEEQIALKAEKEANKRPRNDKGDFQTSCNVTIKNEQDFIILADDLLTALKDMNAGSVKNRNHVTLTWGTVEVYMLKEWLRLVKKETLIFTPFEDGFILKADGITSTWNNRNIKTENKVEFNF